jgi:hypothetical protein
VHVVGGLQFDLELQRHVAWGSGYTKGAG